MCCGGGERCWEDFKPGAVNQEAEGSGKSLGFISVIHALLWMNATEEQIRLWRKGSLLAGTLPVSGGKGLDKDKNSTKKGNGSSKRKKWS